MFTVTVDLAYRGWRVDCYIEDTGFEFLLKHGLKNCLFFRGGNSDRLLGASLIKRKKIPLQALVVTKVCD